MHTRPARNPAFPCGPLCDLAEAKPTPPEAAIKHRNLRT
jgi:hypothetical protein